MLSKAPVTATIGVKDMDKASKFYEETLGLKPTMKMEGDDGVLYECGAGTTLYVYPTEFGATNKATYVSWKVDDIAAEMKELRDKGVKFEDYDMETLKTVDGVATWGDMKSAWFKDPDGNILSLMETS